MPATVVVRPGRAGPGSPRGRTTPGRRRDRRPRSGRRAPRPPRRAAPGRRRRATSATTTTRRPGPVRSSAEPSAAVSSAAYSVSSSSSGATTASGGAGQLPASASSRKPGQGRRDVDPRAHGCLRASSRRACGLAAGRAAVARRRSVSSSSSSASVRHSPEEVDVGQQVPVGGDAVEDAAVVRRHADRQRVAGQQRVDGVGLDHLGAGGVERELRAGHVGDAEVEALAGPLRGRDPRPERVEGGGREAGDPGEPVGGDGPAGLLVRLERVGHLGEPHDRAGLADREVDVVRSDLAAERGRLELVVDDRHRDDRRAAGARPPSTRTGPAASRAGRRRWWPARRR